MIFKKVKRTWGYWIEIFRCKYFCVKLLNFNEKSHISKQRHKFRTELWFVLSGCGKMIYNHNHFMFRFDHLKIRPNRWHQFITPFEQKCTILEIQYGSDVREDDIERV